MLKNNIIVTGGTGMVGSAFKSILPQAEYISRDQFHNLSYDIRDKHVIHLAAKVGGVKANTDYIADFYHENCIINQKILDHAHAGRSAKVVSLLSTCVYPDAPYIEYPLTEKQLHLGHRTIQIMDMHMQKEWSMLCLGHIVNNMVVIL